MNLYFPFGAFFVNVIFAVLPLLIFTYFFLRAVFAFLFELFTVSFAPLLDVTLTVVLLPFFTVFFEALIVADTGSSPPSASRSSSTSSLEQSLFLSPLQRSLNR